MAAAACAVTGGGPCGYGDALAAVPRWPPGALGDATARLVVRNSFLELLEDAPALGPVESGDYYLVMTVRAGRHSSVEAARQPVSLRPGENKTTMSIPALHKVTVTGLKPGTNAWLRKWYNAGAPGSNTVTSTASSRLSPAWARVRGTPIAPPDHNDML